MINLIFRFFLTFNATSLILVVYLVKSQKVFNGLHSSLANLPHFVSYIIYFAIPVLLTLLSLFLSKWLTDDSIEAESLSVNIDVASIREAKDEIFEIH